MSTNGAVFCIDSSSSANNRCSYEEAISKTGNGKFHTFLLFTSGVCLMSVIVETFSIGYVIPLIDSECKMMLSLFDKGLLNGAAFAGVIITSHFWGFLADTWGRKKVLHLGSALTFVFSFISGFSNNVWLLIVTRFTVGAFVSGITANTYAYLGEFHSDKTRAKAVSFAGVFTAMAFLFCPGLAWILVKLQPAVEEYFSIWRIYLFSCTCLSLMNSVLLFFLPESPKFLLAQGRDAEALKTLQKIHARNSNSNSFYDVKSVYLGESLLVQQNVSFLTLVWNQTIPLFKPPLLLNTVKTSFIMFSLLAVSSGFFMWVPEILNKSLDHKERGMFVCDVINEVLNLKMNDTTSSEECNVDTNPTIYTITFLMGLVFVIVYFVNGLIIMKVGKKKLLVLLFVFCGICGLLIPWMQNYYLMLFLIVAFVSVGVCANILSAILIDLFPTSVRAMSLCLVYMLGRIGAMAGSIFVSHLIKNQCYEMFCLLSVILLLSALISITF